MSPPPRVDAIRSLQIAFGTFALASVLLGLALYHLGDALGVPPDRAHAVARAFIAAGVVDALVLLFWDRLLGRR